MTRETGEDFVKGILIALVIAACAAPFIPGAAHSLRDHFYNVSLKKSDVSQDGAASQSANTGTNSGANTSSAAKTTPTSATTTTDTSSDYSSAQDYSDYGTDYNDSYTSSYDYNTPSYDYSGYYNVDDNYIPSPNYSGDTIGGYSPTYTCADGSYSYAQHGQGACSYHGGVAY
jgi:hypothetical protein